MKGLPYLYLCKSHRQGNKVRQEVVKYIGRLKIGKLSDRLIKSVFRRDNYKCADCHSMDNLTLCRMSSSLKGKKNIAKNLKLLCMKCRKKRGIRNI